MDAILILGAAVWADGPSPTLRRRTLHGAAIWRQHSTAIVVPCGGIGAHGLAEADVMRDILIAQGVPDALIRPEDRSTTTLQNIQFALPILAQAGATDIAIVTDWTHRIRAAMVARHFRLNATMASPSIKGVHRPTLIFQFLREIAAIPIYAMRLRRVPRGPVTPAN